MLVTAEHRMVVKPKWEEPVGDGARRTGRFVSGKIAGIWLKQLAGPGFYDSAWRKTEQTFDVLLFYLGRDAGRRGEALAEAGLETV
jgi:hypothetical protein